MTTTLEVDWKAAVAAAEGLGRITLLRVAERDPDAVRDWCLQMSRAHIGEGNAQRALTYLELAVITGYHEEEVADLAARGWGELEKAAEQNAASVRLRAKEAAEAKARVEAAKAEREKEKEKEKAAGEEAVT